MGSHRSLVRRGVLLLLALAATPAWAQAPPRLPPNAVAQILGFEGTLEVRRRESSFWDRAQTNQVLEAGDTVRTGRRSRALLRFSNLEMVPLADSTTLRVEGQTGGKRGLELLKGMLYFFHRDRPDRFDVRTPQMSAIIRGTEFTLAVTDDGTSTLSLIEGAVELGNAAGRLQLSSGEQAVVEPGRPPRRTPLLEPAGLIQWRLYYPAILDPSELTFSRAGRQALAASLQAYASGDLLGALAAYPDQREPASGDERLYLAAMLLAVGQVGEAEPLLTPAVGPAPEGRTAVLAAALQQLIGLVKSPALARAGAAPVRAPSPRSATAALAASYAAQAASDLSAALASARAATQLAPAFSFAWVRVAELEFGFGHVEHAREAIERGLQLGPKNAQAHAVRGFLLAAENRVREAEAAFGQSLALDPALGNAWLGRGLCRIKLGQAESGRQDLQAAAAVEPNRALLRSYLGKAFEQVGDSPHARHELNLAQQMDRGDPTAWLYSALLNQQENRINDGIRDLEHSQALNRNRQVYRSGSLLDQDAAVRGANLAALYRDAGMPEVSVREAARAVTLDYANYSAHLFLANSFNELRDPGQFNLRYETPWLSEFLVANLLAPIGAGTLSPLVTQQEYSRLFERNRLGLASSTEYRSEGEWMHSTVQHGAYDDFGYAAEVGYRSANGHRPNNDVEQLTTLLRVKQQVTPSDLLFLAASYYDGSGGDVRPVYQETRPNLNLGLRTREVQEPLLLGGLQHQWSPGMHTLLLGAWVEDDFRVRNPAQVGYLVQKNSAGDVRAVLPAALDQHYRVESSFHSAELQQILQRPRHTAIAGGRYQSSRFDAVNEHPSAEADFGFPPGAGSFTNTTQRIHPQFERTSLYAYDHFQAWDNLTLIGGLSYDRVRYPENFRYAPLSPGERSVDALSPKAGLVWTPHPTTTLRAAYTRSLGGVAYDQSFQLEPAQLAGFVQTYRSIIPEAVAGANAAPRSEVFGLALDQKFPTGTYLGLSGEWLGSKVHRTTGVYDAQPPAGGIGLLQEFPSGTPEHFDYTERSFTASVNQLLGQEWSLGARYRLSAAELEDNFPRLVQTTGAGGQIVFSPRQHTQALLHQLNLHVGYTHPCGLFGQLEGIWTAQDNDGYSPARPGDEFWQFNVWAGYRFPRRWAELRLGLANLTDRSYRLNPLNLTADLPHDRTLVAGLKLSF